METKISQIYQREKENNSCLVVNYIAPPPLPHCHQGSLPVLVEMFLLVTTLTTASCSMPALVLVKSISSSVGTKAKPILR